MPLPNDEKLLALANDLIHQIIKIFGEHPGFRPAHAKGAMFTGTFTPTAGAASLTKAPHATRPSTPVTVRFSNSTGIPLLPDNEPNANPRGLAVRFHLAEHVHTDIVSHSTDGFPTRDGNQFLEFLRAVAASGPDVPSPKPVELFLGSRPLAMLDIEERVNDVLDALGGYIAGPRSVRRIAPIVPNADQIRRITLEKSTRVPRGRPLGQITLARYRRRRRS